MKLEVRNWVVVGIDPGKLPTICVVWDRGEQIRFFEHEAVGGFIAESPLSRKVKHRDQPDPGRIRKVIAHHRPHLVVIEKVWVMPHQGISSQAKLVRCCALCEGVTRGLDYSTLMVFPQTWQRYYGLIGQEKDKHRRRAMQIEAAVTEHVTRAKDHNRADAFLLAHFGLMYLDKTYEQGVRTRGEALDWIPAFHAVR